jgi:hypothetical protein
MSKVSWRIGLGVLLAVAACCWSASAQQPYSAAPVTATAGSSPLVANFLAGEGGKPTTLTIVDPQLRTIGVYHINRESGEIHLKSVRNFSADLQIDQYNSNSPLPQEIREGLGRLPQ